MTASGATAAALLTILALIPSFQSLYPRLESPAGLIPWILEAGGQVDIEVAAVDASGLRGTIASRDFRAGEAVAVIPYSRAWHVGPRGWNSAELAVKVLRKQYEEPALWQSFEPYWRSLPAKGKLCGKYAFSREHVPLLQSEDMEELVTRVLDWIDEVYSGQGDHIKWENSFAAVSAQFPDAERIQADDIGHFAALLDAYAFAFYDANGEPSPYLLPLLDLINHAAEGNTIVKQVFENETFAAVALRDIRKGEEVTWSYTAGPMRGDKALLNYFFVDGRQRPPLLAAVDLPGGSLVSDEGEPRNDAAHAAGGALCTQEEAQRLQAILVGFPTTEAQDRALLEGGEIRDWRARMIVDFRVARKEALRRIIEGIETALARTAGGAGKAAVVPLAGAPDGLQEPTFIHIGAHADDEL